MITKALDQITADDLHALVEDAVPERRQIEYKEKLPGNTDEDRKEFLRDVSSFANAVGGHLIYGMREKRHDGKPTGIPEAVVGLGEINAGAVINSLENCIRNGIAPRMYVATRDVLCPTGPTIVFHVPRSYSSPHMVVLGGDDGFYTRSSAGKYKLRVDEIRNAFLASDSVGDRLRAFRDGRIARIMAGGTPVPLAGGPRAVLHVVPFSAVSGISRVGVPLMEAQLEKLVLIAGGDRRYNFDGYAVFNSQPDADSFGYVQIFRTGALEAVDAFNFASRDGQVTLPGAAFEKDMVEALGRLLEVEKAFEIDPPLMVAITLIGVRGCIMTESLDPGRRKPRQVRRAIDDDVLPVTEEIVEEYGLKPERILRPIFDVIWQSADWSRSLYYNKDGEWDLK